MTTFGDALCVIIDRTLFTEKLQRCIRTERISVEDAPLLSGVPDLVHQGIIDDRSSKYLPLTFHHAENLWFPYVSHQSSLRHILSRRKVFSLPEIINLLSIKHLSASRRRGAKTKTPGSFIGRYLQRNIMQ